MPPTLHKDISLLGVFAIALGATISSIFFLPGMVYREIGPAVLVAYVLAALVVVPPLLCKAELTTAMPKAGGVYFYLDRAFGPMAGAVAGLGTWISLTLKTSFVLVGSGYYLALFIDDAPITLIACALALLFGVINILGAGKTAKMQAILVVGVVLLLGWFIVQGATDINTAHFDHFFTTGSYDVVAMTGIVLVSYMGLTKVASVAEEVRNPERNIPLGIILALIAAVLIYLAGVAVMIGTIPGPELAASNTPAALSANFFAGPTGRIVVSIAAIASFLSAANAGILSASRYPLAMSRDHMIPAVFRSLGRFGTPVPAILSTVIIIMLQCILLDPLVIAKYAGTTKLLLFGMLCLALIVMRESRLASYDPGFRSPFYPWLPLVGIAGCVAATILLGWIPILFTVVLISVALIWFRFYASSRVRREGAIYQLFSRLGRQPYDPLDIELRGIIKEKGLRPADPFDEIIARAHVIDAAASLQFEDLAESAGKILAEETGHPASSFTRLFLDGTRVGATPVTGGVALPHLRMSGLERSHLVLVRCPDGMEIEIGLATGDAARSVHVDAMFFMASPDSDPTQHLRLLASLASAVEQDGFMNHWRQATSPAEVKAALLRNDRSLTLAVEGGGPYHHWIDQPLSAIDFPADVLVALVYRDGQRLVPSGRTILRDQDHLIIIGEASGISALRSSLGLPD